MDRRNICRVCLSDDAKYCIRNLHLQEIFEKITSTKLVSKNQRSDSVCLICSSQLQKCYKFMELAQKSEQILTKLYHSGRKLTREIVECVKRENFMALSVTCLNLISHSGYDEEEMELVVKLEQIESSDGNDGVSKPKKFNRLTGTTKHEDEDKILIKEMVQGKFSCDHCNKTFRSKNILKLHLKKIYFCKMCRKHYSESRLLYNHVKKKHPDKHPFQCNECDKIAYSASDWKRHIETHLGIRRFKCDHCSKKFAEKGTLRRHMITHTMDRHLKLKNHSATYKTKKNIYQLKQHNTLTHTKKDCSICGEVFETNNSLKIHRKTHKNQNLGIINKDIFKCHKCDDKFNTTYYLKQHYTLKHTQKKCNICGDVFKTHCKTHPKQAYESRCLCQICGRTLSSLATLKNHVANHKDDKPFACKLCGKRFVRKIRLAVHIRGHAGVRPYACDKCGRTFAVKNNLLSHMWLHSGNKPYSCRECGKGFVQKNKLTHHLKTHRVIEHDTSVETSPNNLVKLEVVNEIKEPLKTLKQLCYEKSYPEISVIANTFKQESDEANALETAVAQPKRKFCDTNFVDSCELNDGTYQEFKTEESCNANPLKETNKTFILKEEFEQPISPKGSPEKSNLTCDICHKNYATRGTLKKHKRIHTAEKSYKCDFCARAFHQKGNLQAHIKLHTGDVKASDLFPCKVCNKTLSSKRHLKEHSLRKHSDEAKNTSGSFVKFNCELCQKSYREKKSLHVHMRVHTGERPYTCAVCGLSFSRQNTLNKHLKIHTGVRSEPCDICGKTFSVSSSLLKHKMQHSGDKPFTCKICNKSYNRKDTLKTHLKTHARKEFECNICLKFYATKRNLAKHMKIHVHKFE